MIEKIGGRTTVKKYKTKIDSNTEKSYIRR